MQTDAPRGGKGLRLGPTGLHGTDGHGIAAFADAVLRGVGQVVFLNNAYSGLLCLLAIALVAPAQAAGALAGTAVATAVGMALRADRDALRGGIYGYNGCLVALALPQFLGGGVLVWALAMGAAGLSSALLFALRGRMAGLPPLTAPFVLCTWLAIALVQAFAGDATGAARTVPVPTGLGWGMVDGAFAGLAQIFLQASPLAGALVALALLIGSRSVFLLALMAGLASAAVAWLTGVPGEAIRSGLFGFNAILAAVALGAVFLRAGAASWAAALAAAVVMPLFQAACAVVLVAAGLPVMSLPFILLAWVVLLAARGIPALRPAF